jgi:hypothetical protein
VRLRDGALRRSGSTIGGGEQPCEPGDVVACACDLEKGELTFTHCFTRKGADGRAVRTERVLVAADAGERGSRGASIGRVFPTGGLVPIITVDGTSKLLVNFGERPFACEQSGGAPLHKLGMREHAAGSPLLPVCAWARMRREVP